MKDWVSDTEYMRVTRDMPTGNFMISSNFRYPSFLQRDDVMVCHKYHTSCVLFRGEIFMFVCVQLGYLAFTHQKNKEPKKFRGTN